MSKRKKRLLWFVAIFVTACLVLGLGFILPKSFKNANAEVSVTSENKGEVSLAELCVRHDIQYLIVPGGANGTYMQAHPELQALVGNQITAVRDSANELTISGTVLQGWNTDGTNWSNGIKQGTERSLIVVPKAVTAVTIDNLHKFNPSGATAIDANQSFVGIAFEEGSLLTTVSANAFTNCDNLRFCIFPQRNVNADGEVIEKNITIGNNAFETTCLLSDLVLPEGITSIGDFAFRNAFNLTHVSIPSTVTSVGAEAFTRTYALCDVEINSSKVAASAFPYAMNVYGTAVDSSIATQSYLYMTDSIKDGFAFCMNHLREGVLATIAGANQNYQKNYWYFITLAGLEDKPLGTGGGAETLYIFPDSIDLTAARSEIKWDYLDSAGHKILNHFTSGTVEEYDINVGACYNKYFAHAMFSGTDKNNDAIKTIGDHAFCNSHVTHADFAASIRYIGKYALGGAGAVNNQFYYFRGTGDFSSGTMALCMGISWTYPANNTTAAATGGRHVIFENQAIYASQSGNVKYNRAGDPVTFTYLIPIKTNVFNVAQNQDEPVQTVSYRLAGEAWSFTVNTLEQWFETQNVVMPNLEENSSTVWYADATYTARRDSDDINTLLGNAKSSSLSEINLYTKRFGEPATDIQRYVYDVTDGGSVVTHEAWEALGLDNENYSAQVTRLVNPIGGAATTPSSVGNAGTYTIEVGLASKWGVWKNDYTYNVTVDQKEIDLGNIENLPQFIANGNALGGDNTTLYEYTDGWYAYEKMDAAYSGTAVVTNSYVRYTGEEIQVRTQGIETRYTVESGQNTTATDTGVYNGRFIFRLNEAGDPDGYNYKFTTTSVEANRDKLLPYGVIVETIETNYQVATIAKKWYIVVQSNWLIDSEHPENASFVLVTGDDGMSVRGWEYEAEEGFTIHIPKVANGDTPVTFALDLISGNTTVNIVTGEAVSRLGDYLNSAMPVGSYRVTLTAEATVVGEAKYSEIRESTLITITRKKLNSAAIEAFLNAGKTTPFEQAYSGSLYFHDSVDELIAQLNGSLNTVRNALSVDSANIWKSSEYDAYYQNSVTLAYNLDRMQSSSYYEFHDAHFSAYTAVGSYNVYYSLSALNYQTVGGADDTNRRDYGFETVIYRWVYVSEFAEVGKNARGENSIVYTGNDVRPSVPYNQYYTYAYVDEAESNYTDARNGCKIVVTLSDSKLSRWNETNKPAHVTVEGDIATITFDILPASNSWQISPQIPGWTFDGFNRTVHTVTASLRFDGVAVYYRIGTLTGGSYEWKDFGDGVEGYNGDTTYFTVDENGCVSEEVAAILGSLKPDTYYLAAYAEAYEENAYGISNVAALDTVTNARIVIGKATNRWTTSPNVVRWNWGEYNRAVNKISGTPLYLNLSDTVQQQVRFTVLDAEKKAIAGLIGFTLENGLVDENVAGVLATLSANKNGGTYYLLATVAGTDYYTGLNELPADLTVEEGVDLGKSEYGLDLIPFDVAQAVNYWQTSPSMTGWQYQAFSAGTNFVAGVPKHPETGAVVTYSLYDGENALLKTFTAIDGELTAYLLDCKVGQYRLIASVAGTDDYSSLEMPITFNVTQNTTNAWTNIPSITGWIYGASSAENVTEGKATFGTVTYTVSRNNAEVEGFVGLSFDELKESIALLNAGTYQLTVVSAQTDLAEGQTADYVAATRTLVFVVEKADNEWAEQEEPSITGWTWGEYDETVNAAYNGKTAHEYAENKISGAYWVTNSEGRLLMLVQEEGGAEGGVPTLAGLYAYVVTAEETVNYKELTATVYFEIKQATNVWEIKPETTISWTWGDTVKGATADDAFALVRAAAAYGSVLYTIEGNKANGDSVSLTATAQTIQAVLQSLGAGTYNVVTSVANDDGRYTGLDTPTSISVGKGTLAWKEGTAPADTGWKWDALTKTFLAPVAVGVEQGNEVAVAIKYEVTYTPYIGSAITTTLNDAETLKRLLTASGESTGHAGVYVIAITATDENYNPFVGSMTVTIERATNVWTGSQPSDTSAFYKEFGAGNFPTLGSSSGAAVRYELRTEGSKQEITNVVNWANGLSADKYAVYVVVDATNDYTVLEKEITVEVKPSSRSWTNSDYDTNKTANFGETFAVIVPYMSSIPAADQNGKVTYTVTYALIGSSDFRELAIEDLSATALNDYFKQIRDAGTYKITAKYDSGDSNVQSLEHTLTVTVKKVDVSFGATQPSTTVSFSYQGAELTIPDAGYDYQGNAHVITYSVVGADGVTHTPAVGADLNEFLNTLDVGTYTLTTSVALDNPNYNGKSVITTVLITKASNGWVSGHAPVNTSIVRGGSIANYAEPQAQRGNDKLTITIAGGNLAQSVQQPASNLKNYLESLPAGVYTITYSVPDDENNNYDGFTAETQFTVSLQANGWQTTLNQTYSLTWSPDGIQGIPTPAATNAQSNPVRFEITLADGTTVLRNGSTAEEFEAWLQSATAGTYIVNYYVEASLDVAGIDRTISTVTLAKRVNTVTSTPADSIEWIYGGAENTLPTFRADYLPEEASGTVYYVNGVQVEGNLRNALNSLPVGTYTLRAEIRESANYHSGYADVRVVVVQGENGWEEGYDFAIIESEKNTESGMQTYVGWQWGNLPQTSLWSAPKPLRSNSVAIAVTNKATNEVVISFTLIYSTNEDGTATSNAALLDLYLRALNAGSYTITAEIPASANWSVPAGSAKSIDFTVEKNVNEWVGGDPHVTDWTYGSARNLPTVGGVKYGSVQDIRYTYYLDGKEVNDFNVAGAYTFVAELAASPDGNYDALIYKGSFTIAKLKGGWQTAAGITGWTWNEFDAEKNLFVGAAASGGEVVFQIIDAKGTVVVDGLKPDENGVITDAQKLAVLKNENVMLAGTYSFVAHVAATQNYEEETKTGSFTIQQAQNRWQPYPTITMWAENLWSSSTNMPEAAARYGNITITITDDNADESKRVTYFEATYDSQGNLIGEPTSSLLSATAGKYLLRGYVAADAGRYEGLDYTTVIEIFLSTIDRPVNHWTVYPKISNWTAGEDGPAIYEAVAYRSSSLVTTFYYAADGEKTREVPEEELNANGFPTTPGDYIMNIVSEFSDADGYYAFDRLEENIPFTIKKRIIEWTVTPNIVDWQLSGEASKPVAEFNFGNEEESTLTILYKAEGQADSEAVSTLPTAAGTYEMIVIATAKYCDPVEARVAFKVSLAKNSWKEIPVIEGWSEEFDPNDPLGMAEFGEITYVYRNSKGEEFTERPTQEGTYTLCATVELAGYETLYAEYEFVITPAFDTTLLTVDIVLASVLCVLTVVVIVFAIRRYRENG